MVQIEVTDDVRDFIRSIDDLKLRAKVYRGFQLLANNWPYIGEPHVKPMTGKKGLWELREQLGSKRVRIFFFQQQPHTLVMIHGIVKKTQKTPKRELDIAELKMNAYIPKTKQKEN
ncbi:MAG TPA: type II toxin-antitoxin system RelE/ParE family toxin [Spirochaetia bacterium]|nr:type II toxin-antitoxin system RelE/ParE family toxin [Spirochaetia bacterium]